MRLQTSTDRLQTSTDSHLKMLPIWRNYSHVRISHLGRGLKYDSVKCAVK